MDLDSIQKNYGNLCSEDFFAVDVVTLAKNLLGKYIIRPFKDKIVALKIVETEAYKAPLDKACHAYNNLKNNKTKYFWQKGGHAYIYQIYSHQAFNISAGTAEEPEAVLIRSVEPSDNCLEFVQQLRKCNKKNKNLGGGCGRVGGCMNIKLSDNGQCVFQPGEIFITEGVLVSEQDIIISKRINIDYAEEWVEKPWRWYIRDNKYVSVK